MPLLASRDKDACSRFLGDVLKEKAEFNRIKREQGLKAALAWRDAKFR